MRGIDLFCASQAATAIHLSMDQPSSSSSSSSSSTVYLAAGGGGGRAIDRHNPIIRDAKRIGKALTLNPPCTNISQSPPVPPQPYSRVQHKGGRKTSSSKSNDQTKKSSSSNSAASDQKKKKSTSDKQSHLGSNPRDFISPPASSRYLLGDTALSDNVLSDSEPGLAVVPADVPKLKAEGSSASNAPPPSSSPPPDQVVVLRVSLHCKGCEGKLRKHLSRMQGVTSFEIEFAAKKVTVVGKVTPLGVLESISKVKNAQLWTPPMSSASSVPATGSNVHSQIKKNS